MNNSYILIFLVLMIFYWIYLLLKYEKDKKYKIQNIKSEDLMDKYNPLIAGCIQGNRNPVARDILGVILNLIEKRCIKYEHYNMGEYYEHYVMKNPEKESRMDEVEKYIYDWFFRNQNDKVNLFTRLNIIGTSQYYKQNMEVIKKISNKKLKSIGANLSSVPKSTRVFNTILAFICIIVSIVNLFQIAEVRTFSETQVIWTIVVIVLGIIFSTVGLINLLAILLQIIVSKVHKTIKKISNKKVVTTSIIYFIIFIVCAIGTCVIFESTEILLNELLITMALIITVTDNYMLKNSPRMIEDFSRLNSFKEQMEEDTFLKEKSLEDVVLWGKYLAYAISFGVSKKVMNNVCYDSELRIENIEVVLESMVDTTNKVFSFMYSEGMPNSDDALEKTDNGANIFKLFK